MHFEKIVCKIPKIFTWSFLICVWVCMFAFGNYFLAGLLLLRVVIRRPPTKVDRGRHLFNLEKKSHCSKVKTTASGFARLWCKYFIFWLCHLDFFPRLLSLLKKSITTVSLVFLSLSSCLAFFWQVHKDNRKHCVKLKNMGLGTWHRLLTIFVNFLAALAVPQWDKMTQKKVHYKFFLWIWRS